MCENNRKCNVIAVANQKGGVGRQQRREIWESGWQGRGRRYS